MNGSPLILDSRYAHIQVFIIKTLSEIPHRRKRCQKMQYRYYFKDFKLRIVFHSFSIRLFHLSKISNVLLPSHPYPFCSCFTLILFFPHFSLPLLSHTQTQWRPQGQKREKLEIQVRHWCFTLNIRAFDLLLGFLFTSSQHLNCCPHTLNAMLDDWF